MVALLVVVLVLIVPLNSSQFIVVRFEFCCSTKPSEGDGHESTAQVPFAWDNNVATVWSTELYQDRDVGGLKSGVGLVIDVGTPKKIVRLELSQ